MGMKVMNQNNVLAGSFVIGGVLLAVVISFVLGDLAGKFGEKNSYLVRFPTHVGVMGLEPGADVTFAGLRVGEVVSVGMHIEKHVDSYGDHSGHEIAGAMDVVIELDAGLVLFEDAIADLSPPILGGVSRINIASAGNGGARLVEGGVMVGRFAPSILRQMGLGAEEAQKIKDMIAKFPEWSAKVTKTMDNVEESTAGMLRMTQRLEPKFNSGVDDGKTTMENVRIFSERLSAEGGWKDQIDSTLTSVEEASAKFGPAIDDARGTMASVQETIDENRGKVGRIMDHVEATTERVRFETIDKANDLLARGSLALGSAEETLGEVQGILIENRPRINSTMVNVEQLSLQGKLMVEEIKSQPWRLMNKPSKKDLRREPLYEATRMYAGAVADLHTASQSLDTAVRLAGGKGSDSAMSSEDLAAELLRLAALVDQAYGRYEEAERGLLRVWADSP